ncbi:MAG: oxygen-independent coproporphyrinogen III oxidase [Alphaproteobacteria bacterium]|nr:oxygen-independent coproporphyrinogen III oxidase [Alphaproteobacteria bacterium]
MNQVQTRYAARQTPRYTSYPTAPHFHPGVGAAAFRSWLAQLAPDEPLSLYLHVPFCRQLCWYCGCHMMVANRDERVTAYARLLEDELQILARSLPPKPRLAHIHWGGGSPSILSEPDFARLMERIGQLFTLDPDCEVAMEVDPRDLGPDQARAMARAGVNRASLGVQDFSPHVQQKINRIQPYEQVALAADALRAAGIKRLNFDLMYGLPGQSVADVERTTHRAADLSPDRMAVFGYAHVPWMKKHQRMIDEAELPGTAERCAEAEVAEEVLLARGYERIGLDHFARPDDPLAIAQRRGQLRRNFQGYTTDQSPLLGLGASAISALPHGYAQNVARLPDYAAAIEMGEPATCRGIALSEDDHLRRAIIERLMCNFEADLHAACADHGVSPETLDQSREQLAALAQDGLAELNGDRVQVTELGRRYVRHIAACFDAYLNAAPQRHSRAV